MRPNFLPRGWNPRNSVSVKVRQAHKTSWTVVEFDAPRRQVHRTQDIPIARELLVIMEVASAGDASTITITLRSTSSLGPFGAGLFAVLKPQTRDNKRSIRNLAELATRELPG